MPDRYEFSDLELAPGYMVLEGYAVIGPGQNIGEIYTGSSKNNLIALTDPHLYAAIFNDLNENHIEKIAAQFGCDLNSGLSLTYHQVAA